ncbi:hypothetical protein HZC00_00400 [Candidatus Kaiserbacteria bacterium]|nr:hypothetical protein [Candidatus Kaiserbacteria bacterium]
MLNNTELKTLWDKVMAVGSRPPFLFKSDFVYLMGQTRDNQGSVLDVARGFTSPVGMPGHDFKVSGYPGFGVWKQALINRGVSEDQIVPIHGSLITLGGKDAFNSLTEAYALVRYAKEQGLHNVVIVAPAWHIVRSYMSAVAAVRLEYPELRVYPVLGAKLPWDERVAHSQGTLTCPRWQLIFEETNRIYAYHAKGDLPDPEDVLAYMDELYS